MRVGRTVYAGKRVPGQVNDSGNWILRLLCFCLLAGAAMFLMYSEWNWKAMNDSYTLVCKHNLYSSNHEVRSDVVSLPDNRVSPSYANDIVHLTSSNLRFEYLHDNQFNFGGHSLKFKRVTEYCQWQQFSEEKEDRQGHKFRTYYYVKSWHSHRIPSFLFDQPFHHNNPQRDPTPMKEFVSNKASMGEYTLNRPIIERISAYTTYDFNKYPNGNDIFQSFTQSEAYRAHKFTSLGKGYFYSAYDESKLGFLARLAGMAMEGSFDVQLGQLFSTCTAGDIRVHFEIINPSSLSVIGKQLDASGNIGLFMVEKFHYSVGILYPGIYNSDELFDQDIWDNFLRMLIIRIAAFIVWSLFFHVVNEIQPTLFSFFYFGLAINLASWVVVRITDISTVALSFRNSPFIFVSLVGLLLFFAAKHHANPKV